MQVSTNQDELQIVQLALGITVEDWEQLPKFIQDMYEGPTCTGCYLLKGEYDQG